MLIAPQLNLPHMMHSLLGNAGQCAQDWEVCRGRRAQRVDRLGPCQPFERYYRQMLLVWILRMNIERGILCSKLRIL
jgi:hypothetical protein